MRSKRSLNLLKRPSLCFSLNPDSGGGPRAGPTLTPVCEPVGHGRARVRLRVDDLAMFSADATPLIPYCVPSSPSTSRPSTSTPGRACCSATPAGFTAATATPAPAPCSASSAPPGTGIQLGFPAPRHAAVSRISSAASRQSARSLSVYPQKGGLACAHGAVSGYPRRRAGHPG
jgi:hypothetical protein